MDPLYVTLATAKSSRSCVVLENRSVMDFKSDWHGSEAGVSFSVETLETQEPSPLDAVASVQILNQPAQVVRSVLSGPLFDSRRHFSCYPKKGLFGSVL